MKQNTTKQPLEDNDYYKNMPTYDKFFHKSWNDWAKQCFTAGKNESENERKALLDTLKEVSQWMKSHDKRTEKIMANILSILNK